MRSALLTLLVLLPLASCADRATSRIVVSDPIYGGYEADGTWYDSFEDVVLRVSLYGELAEVTVDDGWNVWSGYGTWSANTGMLTFSNWVLIYLPNSDSMVGNGFQFYRW